MGAPSLAGRLVESVCVLAILALASYWAYSIRLYAIETYGRVIHEFDPWFNFRATVYLAKHGSEKFFKWFDHESWYPLGRPIGTTIYPGMQFTSVAIWEILKNKVWKQIFHLNVKMSLNDVCCFVPAWGGATASLALGALTREVSGSWRAGAMAALVMSMIPAHLMRSVGGGYDNESVAMTAMCLTFYFWCRSLRTPSSWWIGILAGVAYFYMVAAWGGFIFVCNMVGVHAGALVALGYYSSHLHKAYSLWYIVGTSLATTVPVVGMSPFRSMEQLGPCAVFVGLQFIAICEEVGRRRGLQWPRDRKELMQIRITGLTIVGGVAAIALAIIIPTGYFGPLSVRVKSLFVKHTKTGNPLVDSVAEHQPASEEAYWNHLHYTYVLVPIGFCIALTYGMAAKNRLYHGVQVNKWFLILYTAIAYYFANRMMRLIILLGPVASIHAGIVLAAWGEWSLKQVFFLAPTLFASEDEKKKEEVAPAAVASSSAGAPSSSPAAKGQTRYAAKEEQLQADKEHPLALYRLNFLIPSARSMERAYDTSTVQVIRVFLAMFVLATFARYGREFAGFCDSYARQVSQPSIKFKSRLSDGTTTMINDYQEAYWWIRDNTPQDSRVLSWWDYGYQINGIANRTTLADGNTWNLEHIALIGRMLTLPEKKAHKVVRLFADYVLVWAGGGGDDLAKSPHMARISSSVYKDLCPNDPLCRNFGFIRNPGDQSTRPTPSMAASMLYKMHSHNRQAGVKVDPTLFQEAYTSKYGLVRVFKVLDIDTESKSFMADPSNRVCDAPGSWYCVGQYPPQLKKADRPGTKLRHLIFDENH